MIRDTAAQDRALSPPSNSRRWLLTAAAVVLAILAFTGAVARWASAERSIDGARVRIAEVSRGTLVRDTAVNGRVVAAVSLALAREIAEAHGGSISLGNRPDGGLSVALTLPTGDGIR